MHLSITARSAGPKEARIAFRGRRNKKRSKRTLLRSTAKMNLLMLRPLSKQPLIIENQTQLRTWKWMNYPKHFVMTTSLQD
jgi:hypothetical protein